MALALAVVAERDASLRRLMRAAVGRAEYHVVECSNSLQLKVELCMPRLLEAPVLLLILSIDIAKQCTEELELLLRSRTRAGRPLVSVTFTSEFGAPQHLPLVDSAYALAGILEKPFQLEELQFIAGQARTRGGVVCAP